MYADTQQTGETAELPVMQGILLFYSSWARVLFDSDASHSFTALRFACSLGLETESVSSPLHVRSPLGQMAVVDRVCRSCVLTIGNLQLIFDLDMSGFDVYLGMDWLSAHRVAIDCHQRRVSG